LGALAPRRRADAEGNETIAKRYWERARAAASLASFRACRLAGWFGSPASSHPIKENLMRKYLIAAALTAAFVTPALAEQFYVILDPASHKCEAMHYIPEGKKSMGTYGTMDEAKKAMGTMKECG
jgi:hypothetical protein